MFDRGTTPWPTAVHLPVQCDLTPPHPLQTNDIKVVQLTAGEVALDYESSTAMNVTTLPDLVRAVIQSVLSC